MATAMAVQQRVSHPGGEVSEQQKMMTFLMPIMFGIFFYNMASALVLYWLTNTVYTLLMQEVVLKSRKPV
jgi:membrane protein insertase Oxa1/YidC/SpoIIIJ